MAAPSTTLPKGGGAIRNIGEKFAANPVTGTGSVSVPIHTSPGRAGVGPQLALSYDSGAGNGPFGYGWTLALPSVRRKTDKGLPLYQDAAESDVFILSDAEDLVPVCRQDPSGTWVAAHPGHQRDAEGSWVRDARGRFVVHEDETDGYRVRRYRPRIEGLFARIERWSRVGAPDDVHWRSISKENVLTIYGLDEGSRIADPVDPERIFSWLISETRDDRGNAVIYRYKAEDGTGVDRALSHERNRGRADDVRRTANRYLKRIHYGNRASLLDDTGHRPRFLDEAAIEAQLAAGDWMFEVVLDYGDHDPAAPAPADDRAIGDGGSQRYPWPSRPDSFSSYRAGFEVRTRRLCRRVLMFHHFAGETGVGRDCLVRSTDLTYTPDVDPMDVRNPVYSFLRAVSEAGYRRSGAGYTQRALPPIEFQYSEPIVHHSMQHIDTASLENVPAGLADATYHWADLHGDGLPGILIEQADTWHFKRNLSPLSTRPDGGARPQFGPMTEVALRPSASLNAGATFMDLAGDGQPDLVVLEGAAPGLFEHDTAEGWAAFRPFSSLPNRDFRDPNLRFVDLDGDGHADLLITEDEALTWHPSLSERGFDRARRRVNERDEEKGPRIVFSDGSQSVYLADLSGDGQGDLVRIRNNDVCYWPALGHGRFGAKVTMDNSPRFDEPDSFDQRRIRLADIDGSGTTDIIYLHRAGIRLYFNQSGNSWSKAHEFGVAPRADDLTAVVALDLLGNGTACLVWSSPLPGDATRPMQYLDLMGGRKPHLLIVSVNNFGAERRVTYAPSTKFYLADQRAGRPWADRLPFPVHVVETIETVDHVSGTRFASRYAYHHGHFDGEEREFRGFGMVEQWDTEAFEDYVVGVQAVGGNQELEPELNQPPVTTRTWYHTGSSTGADGALHSYVREYHDAAALLPESSLPRDGDPGELRECLRALKGMAIRQEIYSFDGSPRQAEPYVITENRYEIRRIQPRGSQRHAVVQPVGCETISLGLDRNPTDPRISHSFGLDLDEYGLARKSCTVAYGRETADPSLPAAVRDAQARAYIVYAETDYTSDIRRDATESDYRLRVPCETRTFEITGVTPDADIYRLAELGAKVAAAAEVPYEHIADGLTAERRLVSQGRTYFLDNALNPLPLRQWDTMALGHRSFRLAFTPGVVVSHFNGAVTDADFVAAGYVHDGDANWWIPSGTSIFSANPRAQFYLPIGARDPFGLETHFTFDAHVLLTQRAEVAQSPWNVVTATNDYRVLAPVLTTDANQNRSAVEHDELGMVIKTAVMGKAGSAEGDTLADPTTRLEYELRNWIDHGKPNLVRTFVRERHGAANSRWHESYAYSNGAGGVAMLKSQAHPGKALTVDGDGALVEVDADPRWIGNGRTIHNNKGNPVKQYEPYFSATHEYEDQAALRHIGITPILYYDPIGRNTRTIFPDGTLARVEFDSWHQRSFDANDTVKESGWYVTRGSPDPALEPEPLSDPERRAAWLAAKHAETPGVVHSDSLGRSIYAVSDYGGGKTSAVSSEIDLTGRLSRMFDQEGREVANGFVGMDGVPVVGYSAERGRQWTFLDVAGALVRNWDEHGRQFRVAYDELRRPLAHFARDASHAEIALNYFVYGDRLANGRQLNLLGNPHLIFDQSGLLRIPELDFKGNPRQVDRILADSYAADPDWTTLLAQGDVSAVMAAADPALDATAAFTIRADYDALNRPIRIHQADGSVVTPTYNEAGVVASLNVQLGGQGAPVTFLQDQDYDAKGRRQFAHYGNDLISRYRYERTTDRLAQLVTSRAGANPATQAVQSLTYIYDPVGHITQIRDDAQQTHYFNNAVASPEARYEYDAIYQLVRATGRELAGATNDSVRTAADLDFAALPHPNDPNAVRAYSEEYEYDLLGNLTTLRHRFAPQGGSGAGWTRRYRYARDAQPADRTNRLIATSMPGDPDGGPYSGTYTYDAYGNTTRMPHLPSLEWSFMDQLRRVDLGGGGTAHYVYGLGGQRLRKVIERGNLRLEWIFLGGVMVFRRRRRDTGELRFERWTLSIADEAGKFAQVDTKTVDADNEDPANAIGVPLIRYEFGNHLGSGLIETDASGALISYEEYHPFGSTAYRSGRPGHNVSLKRFRFTGKERDDETGLDYSGARYYASWLGRWTSSDPAGFVSGTNLFRYCANNPVMLVDPTGLQEMNRRFALPPDVANVPRGASAQEIQRRAGLLRAHVSGMGYQWTRGGASNPNPSYSNGGWTFGQFDPDSIPEGDPLGILPAPANEPTDGAAANAAGGTAMRNNPPGNVIEVPDSVTDAKLSRLQEGVRQRTVGRNTGPTNPTRARRNTPGQRQALADFETRSGGRPTPNDAAGHRIDMQYDLTGRVGEHWRDYVWEDGATNTNDGFDGFRRLRNQPQGQPAGAVARSSQAGRLRHSSGFRTGMRWAGGGLTVLGTGLSGYGLYQDIVEGDVPMGIGDAIGVVGGGLELYAFGATAFGTGGTTVGGVTVAGVAALPLGIALSGVAVGVTSAVSGVRAYRQGDTAGAVAGAVGTAAGTALAVGGGIALASAAGVAMAPALVAAAPVLIAVGAVAAIGVGIFHLGRHFDWW